MLHRLIFLVLITAFGKNAHAVSEAEFSAALSKAKLDIAVAAVVENCKEYIDNSDPPLACQCALTYSDYENKMAHQIQFERCLNGEVPAELTDTEKLIQLLDVLKNFADQTSDSSRKEKAVELKKNSKMEMLSTTDIDNLRLHVSRCWDPPIGSVGEDNLIVDIAVELDPEGNVQRAIVENKLRFNTDRIFRVAAEEAVRALRECSPLPLPPEKYDSWKNFIFSFDPRFLE